MARAAAASPARAAATSPASSNVALWLCSGAAQWRMAISIAQRTPLPGRRSGHAQTAYTGGPTPMAAMLSADASSSHTSSHVMPRASGLVTR